MNNTTLSKPQRTPMAEQERLAYLKQNMYFESKAPAARAARYEMRHAEYIAMRDNAAVDAANITAVNAANNIVTDVANTAVALADTIVD